MAKAGCLVVVVVDVEGGLGPLKNSEVELRGGGDRRPRRGVYQVSMEIN
jgi:hypothetical protein